MRFANLKIGTRLGAGIAVILTLMAIMGGTGFWGLSQADDALHTMESRLMRVSLAKEWEGILTTHAEMVGRALVTQNPDVVKRLRNDMQAQTRRALAIYKELTESSRSQEGHRMIAAINDAAGKFRAMRDEALAIKERNNPAELSKLDTIDDSLTAAMATYIKAVTDYGSRVEAQAAEAAKHAQSTYVLSTRLLLVAGILALLLGIMIGWLVTRSIVRPIGEAVAVARTVASGDLTQRITPKNKDETGQLLAALRDMNDSLALTVGGIRTGFETISVVSAQIAAGNQDLSSRTEEQASSLEETAASMEELASTVTQNAENARQANQLAASASDVAERGGSAVSEVVGTMNAISDSSHKISEIVSVIDGIAFQTNILALNAAVEAARAGEQGKGFAVVAGEVRTLAQRSANAAKEIKGLIEDSVSKVSVGAQQVERAGATMQEIVTSVKRVTDIMGEISTASEEQARGIEQVNQAVSQMDAVTQQNAALVEESAAASIAMHDQAGELVRSVSTFKLNSVPQTIDVTATIKKTSQIKPASKAKHTPAKAAKPVVAKAAPRLEHKAKKQETTTDVGDEWTSF